MGGGGGGSPEKINKTTISQLMALATFVPSLGRCGQGPWLSILAQIRQFFFCDPCVFGYIFLRKGAYIDFLYIILKHTQ